MYPKQIKHFSEYFSIFHENKYFIHVRRFRGKYNGKVYPQAYSNDDRCFIARYCDKLTIKYMLNDFEENHQITASKLSYAGMNYMMLDEKGEIWPSPDYRSNKSLGNIFDGSLIRNYRYKPYGGSIVGSVNIIASLKEAEMKQLENNHTWCFAQQGGFKRNINGMIEYPFMKESFKDQELLDELNWPLLVE
jgi:hypothetical protein